MAKQLDAIEILKVNHYKVTKQRLALLDYLRQAPDRYVSITQIDEHMRQLFKGISHDTVYRNLKDFQKIGIVEYHNNGEQNQVKYSCDCYQKHHHHFICRSCGQVSEIPDCPMDYYAQQLPNYLIEGHHFEIYGLCPNCQ